MKKSTIWTLTIVITIVFIALLTMQVRYVSDIVTLKKEQFDQSVQKALYQTSRNLELNETLRYLEADISTKGGIKKDTVRNGFTSFQQKMQANRPGSMPKAMIVWNDRNSIKEATRQMQEAIKNRYLYQKALMDDVVYNIVYNASDKPLAERMDFVRFDQDLSTELLNNGVNLPYHFIITTQDGREAYRCPDFNGEGQTYSYTEVLFRNDPKNKGGLVTIHFPDMSDYLYSSIRFLIPAIIFTLILVVIFFITIFLIFRQKKYNEIKNDFINNMTHEL
ncbi:MAG: two-component sensor histidine kinase, partial [Bacteroidaceae bacterium]|nr:two-component sensor histidine kinase [Bacteroidaceae bacterium]